MKMYRTCLVQMKPVEVDCPDGGYPAKDANGANIYVNTHFRREIEAWERIQGEALRAVRSEGYTVRAMEEALAEQKDKAAQAAKAYDLFMSNWEEHQRQEAERTRG